MTTGQAASRAKPFETAMLDALSAVAEAPGRQRLHVRRHFDIGAFGCNAYRAEAGTDVIAEHDETGASAGGHEELYVVVSGHATFTVDGEETDAPAGTLVFVRDPAARRKAVAHETGTTVLVVGGNAGEAFMPSPWESMSEMWPAYQAGDHEGAAAIVRAALERHPGNPAVLFNLACCESLLGQKEQALEHLGQAVGDDQYRTYARTDSDFDAIRDDPRFAALVGEADE